MRQYMAENYPDLDPDKTFELFRDNCLANDRVYASWDAALRNWLRNPVEWGGVAFKDGLGPEWREVLREAEAIGFRKPRLNIETVHQYRSEMRRFVPEQTELLPGVDIGSVIKRVK
jgi:hypothetical protein